MYRFILKSQHNNRSLFEFKRPISCDRWATTIKRVWKHKINTSMIQWQIRIKPQTRPARKVIGLSTESHFANKRAILERSSLKPLYAHNANGLLRWKYDLEQWIIENWTQSIFNESITMPKTKCLNCNPAEDALAVWRVQQVHTTGGTGVWN